MSATITHKMDETNIFCDTCGDTREWLEASGQAVEDFATEADNRQQVVASATGRQTHIPNRVTGKTMCGKEIAEVVGRVGDARTVGSVEYKLGASCHRCATHQRRA